MASTEWLASVHANASARLRLFCFAYAGGAANVFANWWRKLPNDIELCPVELPGRWARWRQEPLRNLVAASRLVADQLASEFSQKPFVLYGHSLGGLIAYETTLRLREAGKALPRALLVSGRRPPDAPLYRPPMHQLPEREFLACMAEHYEAIDARVLADPELKNLFLRALRADVAMYETYRARDVDPLDLPIEVFSAEDDPVAPPNLMQQWGRYSSREFRLHTFSGGHFFVRNNEPFWASLSDVIRTC
jgi:medium-chain acyl-[acyl-carrier-protein] hydrolase